MGNKKNLRRLLRCLCALPRYTIDLMIWRFAKPQWPYVNYYVDPDDLSDFEELVYGDWRRNKPRMPD